MLFFGSPFVPLMLGAPKGKSLYPIHGESCPTNASGGAGRMLTFFDVLFAPPPAVESSPLQEAFMRVRTCDDYIEQDNAALEKLDEARAKIVTQLEKDTAYRTEAVDKLMILVNEYNALHPGAIDTTFEPQHMYQAYLLHLGKIALDKDVAASRGEINGADEDDLPDLETVDGGNVASAHAKTSE